MQINKIGVFKKIWNSPTLTTWASFLTKSLSLVVILPLILTRLTTEEISLWYLFSTIIGLQILIDLGFSVTFSRVISYGLAGATQIKDFRFHSEVNSLKETNWEIIEKICSTMKVIYFRLSYLLFFLLIILGTWGLYKPISETNYPTYAWVAWIIIIITSTITLQGNTYNSYLQGMNQIAPLRRWEALTSIGAIITSFLLLVLGGGLLGLVIANQGWLIINIFRNRWLCIFMDSGQFRQFKNLGIDSDIFQSVWPSAWRSGIGIFMGFGLVQLSGVIYAQVSSAAEVASYLLALRLIQTINQFSQAPFYSKLPLLAILRSEGNLEKQISIAKRGMTLSYWTYTIGFITVGLFSNPLLNIIGSNAEFVSPLLWSLMGFAMFAGRYGGMHMQLYSTTNHIIWHIANGVSGCIYLVVALSLFNKIGVYAFPVGLLASYLGFQCWYSALHSYRAYGLTFWSFERSVMLIPLLVMLGYTAGIIFIR